MSCDILKYTHLLTKGGSMKRLQLTEHDIEDIDMFSRDHVGISTLERYTGSDKDDFQPYILLTNFKKYLDAFSEITGAPIKHGSAMRACHCPADKITIIDFGVGSPVAALIMELISFINPKAVLMLGMCGGLSRKYAVGDFFNPLAAIREEGTSNAYMPPQCPALSSFDIQQFVCEELKQSQLPYHTGVIHTTNVRFWEFNEPFKKTLQEEHCQAIDMECATLFTVGFSRAVPIGALMLISDLPLKAGGVKTKESAKQVFENFTSQHLNVGIAVLKNIHAHETATFGDQF